MMQNSEETLQHLPESSHKGVMDEKRYPNGPVPSYLERGSRSSEVPVRNRTIFLTLSPITREQRRRH